MKWIISLIFKVKEKSKITPEEIEKVEKEIIEKSKNKYSRISSVGNKQRLKKEVKSIQMINFKE